MHLFIRDYYQEHMPQDRGTNRQKVNNFWWAYTFLLFFFRFLLSIFITIQINLLIRKFLKVLSRTYECFGSRPHQGTSKAYLDGPLYSAADRTFKRFFFMNGMKNMCMTVHSTLPQTAFSIGMV